MSGLVGNSRRHVLSCRGSYIYIYILAISFYDQPTIRNHQYGKADLVKHRHMHVNDNTLVGTATTQLTIHVIEG